MPITLGTPSRLPPPKSCCSARASLGKEVLIALQRLGVETTAVDRYDNAPGQQVAHHARTITMSDPARLKKLIEAERPHLVVPEIEAIATPMLEELEAAGTVRVIPTARAARLTMDREGIRRLAAETLGLPTSPYRFCDSAEEPAGRHRRHRRPARHRLPLCGQARDEQAPARARASSTARPTCKRPGTTPWPAAA